ncbi:10228_t:CDS:2 [Funneliformis caledonium]|uniref:10228_t:CDS:1 n=1 Tax=Funneliformis caledonium TaxID=1117310 RepID=A0A9N9F6M7_9GLOM|nr:10228_t:CDS:2 [Funneliformis caledonium]
MAHNSMSENYRKVSVLYDFNETTVIRNICGSAAGYFEIGMINMSSDKLKSRARYLL